MTDQPSLPGFTPELLAYIETRARLITIARELATIDLGAFVAQVCDPTFRVPVEALTDPSMDRKSVGVLAHDALDFKRRLRASGILAQLAIAAHAARSEKDHGKPTDPWRRRG